MLRAIAGRTRLPIVADIDTGDGNAINVIHAITEYERAGASAVVIEDKTFPKVTSLVGDGRQHLLRRAPGEDRGRHHGQIGPGFPRHRPHRSLDYEPRRRWPCIGRTLIWRLART